MTKKRKPTLSNIQMKRFGGFIAIMGGRVPYKFILDDLLENGWVNQSHDSIHLSESGIKEKDRLATLAGLMTDSQVL